MLAFVGYNLSPNFYGKNLTYRLNFISFGKLKKISIVS